METNKFFRNSAIVTALLASLCCITPVLAIFGGLSGIASTFSFLERCDLTLLFLRQSFSVMPFIMHTNQRKKMR